LKDILLRHSHIYHSCFILKGIESGKQVGKMDRLRLEKVSSSKELKARSQESTHVCVQTAFHPQRNWKRKYPGGSGRWFYQFHPQRNWKLFWSCGSQTFHVK